MSYVDQIQDKEGTLHDIHDKRLSVTAADVGKVVSVDENGDIALIEGGTKLYKHVIPLVNSTDNVTLTIISTDGNDYSGPLVKSSDFTIRRLLENAISVYCSFLSLYSDITEGMYLGKCYNGGGGSPLEAKMLQYNSSDNTKTSYYIPLASYSTATTIVDTVTPL